MLYLWSNVDIYPNFTTEENAAHPIGIYRLNYLFYDADLIVYLIVFTFKWPFYWSLAVPHRNWWIPALRWIINECLAEKKKTQPQEHTTRSVRNKGVAESTGNIKRQVKNECNAIGKR